MATNEALTGSSSNASVGKRQDRRRRLGTGKRSKEGDSNAEQSRAKHQRPTHFLSLPLGHHSELQERVGRLHSSLLQSSVKGLDPSILIKPRRLHFTLGVMCLSKSEASVQSNKDATATATATATAILSSSSIPRHTVESALALLRSLQPELSALCAVGKSGSLRTSLETVGAFESKKGARVLWASPREHDVLPESEEDRVERLKLIDVADLIHRAFKDAGYITEDRPLKLHCSLINTSHRKPSSKRPILFSYDEILTSDALREIRVGSESDAPLSPSPNERIVPVTLGTYDIPEIQLCVMGSRGPEDEYISLGGVSFTEAEGQ